jgi:hypothetical protein
MKGMQDKFLKAEIVTCAVTGEKVIPVKTDSVPRKKKQTKLCIIKEVTLSSDTNIYIDHTAF